MITTIEARLKLNENQEKTIDSCIRLWSEYYRKVWILYNNKQLSEKAIYDELSKTNFFTIRQIGSLINKVKTEHSKFKELTKTQLSQHKDKLLNIEKFIKKEVKSIETKNKSIIKLKIDLLKYKKLLAKNNAQNLNKFQNKDKLEIISKYQSLIKETYKNITKLNNSISSKQKTIQSKQIKVRRLNKSILVLETRIKLNRFKLCFGSSELMRQKPGFYTDKHRLTSSQNKYNKKLIKTISKNKQVKYSGRFDLKTNNEDWAFDWDLARNNIIYSVGDKNKPQGNAEIQYYPNTKNTNNGKLRFRVTDKEYLQRLDLIAKNLGTSLEQLNDNKIIANGIYRMQARFIEIENVDFDIKNKAKLLQVLNNKKPISAKIIKKLTPRGNDKNLRDKSSVGYYLQLSFDEVVMDSIVLNNDKNINLNLNKAHTMGIDINEKGLAYAIIKSDGNKLSNKELNKINIKNKVKSHGFIVYDLKGKTTEQRDAIVSNAISKVLDIASQYGVYSIAIENLDFNKTKSSMNAGYKTKTYKSNTSKIKTKLNNQSNKTFNYNDMLSSFPLSKFKELICRKAARLGMTLNLVNPNYSSVGGYAKYGINNKLGVDVSAALWLARQSLYGVEYKRDSNKIENKDNLNNNTINSIRENSVISYKKKFEERIVFPYHKNPKQSKTVNIDKIKWNNVSFALGWNRKLWCKNLIDYIQPDVVNTESTLGFNPFS